MPTSTKSRRSVPPTGAETESSNPLLADFTGEMMGTLSEASSAYLNGVASLNREIVEFINKRLEHDAELGRALGQCKDWKEAAELQQAWVREASQEYAANARTLMEMTTKLMHDTWSPLRRQGETGSDRPEK